MEHGKNINVLLAPGSNVSRFIKLHFEVRAKGVF
jgi:hypothetical protein